MCYRFKEFLGSADKLNEWPKNNTFSIGEYPPLAFATSAEKALATEGSGDSRYNIFILVRSGIVRSIKTEDHSLVFGQRLHRFGSDQKRQSLDAFIFIYARSTAVSALDFLEKAT